ncbi:response regulator [Luteithermobacter gelatinilyticus]|uniref:response regulator n=1 Tax=Luteithermobacter gelatinilyticus TaxID=2582913 RepID=UPI00110661A1|nr:response regulator transcription factor [Luteithermobacter gelatinilyticus]
MRMLLVDDHTLFRDGLKHVLSQLEDDLKILEAGTYEDAMAIIRGDDNVDLVLLDLDLPDMSGLQGVKAVRDMNPVLPVAILSGAEDGGLIRKAMEMGVMGYIPKSLGSEVMLQALRLILKGGRYVPDNILQEDPQERARNFHSLTTRQLEILRLITLGKSNKEIARTLGIADNTVRVHISAIFQVLNVNNRTEAALAALQEGLIQSA